MHQAELHRVVTLLPGRSRGFTARGHVSS
jgi:hypothetical protein